MMLTEEDIIHLLSLLTQETVIEPTEAFPFRVSRAGFGYAKDPKMGRIQAALSIMLEAKRRMR